VIQAIAIYKRELKYYFKSVTAYVTLSIFLFFSGYFFFSLLMRYSIFSYQILRSTDPAEGLNLMDSVMRPLLNNTSIVLLLVLPLVSMRLLSEEKKLGTFELLLTYPTRDAAVIFGKYAAAVTFFLAMIASTALYPILLSVFSDPEPVPILVGYLGFCLMGCTFLSIGIFFSSVTDNQLVAGISTFGASLFFLVIGWIVPFVDSTMSIVLRQFSLLMHFKSFSMGIIDTQDVTYYIFLTVFFLFLTVKSIESARWRS